MLVKMMTNDVPHMIGLIGSDETDYYLGERARMIAKYGKWAVGRAEAMRPAGDVEGIEKMSMRLVKGKAAR